MAKRLIDAEPGGGSRAVVVEMPLVQAVRRG
jgi:hypothetical protein